MISVQFDNWRHKNYRLWSEIQDSKYLNTPNSGEGSKSGSEAASDIGNLASQDESNSIDKAGSKELVKDLESSKQSSDATVVDGTGSVNDLNNDSNNQVSEPGPNYGEVLAQKKIFVIKLDQ